MTTTIASLNPGRAINSYDLLDEIQEQTGLGRTDAHAAIHAMLNDLIALDGEGAVILNQQPARPSLLDWNPNQTDVDYWITITDDAKEAICEAIAATHPRPAIPQVTVADVRRLLACGEQEPVMYVERDDDAACISVAGEADVRNPNVIVPLHELVDALGKTPTDEDIEEYLPLLQATTNEILSA